MRDAPNLWESKLGRNARKQNDFRWRHSLSSAVGKNTWETKSGIETRHSLDSATVKRDWEAKPGSKTTLGGATHFTKAFKIEVRTPYAKASFD